MRVNTIVGGICAGLFVAGSSATAQRSAAKSLPNFDQYVDSVMKTFSVPGAAVAIVKDGRIVLAKGYGVRALGRTDRVDAETRFGIASNTKAFTSTAIAMLVEEGKLQWDAPVIRYLPDFAMYDPFVTRELSVRDLLVHRSGLGLGAGDLLWWPTSTLNRREIMRRLRFIKPATSFRSAYAYDNVLYLVAGELIEKVSGTSWEEFVRTRILTPVGMTGSTVRHADALTGTNTAATHAVVDGTVRVIAPMASDNTNPAGGINSSAIDMARWMVVMLDSGRIRDGNESGNGKRLFKQATTRDLWSIVTPIPVYDRPALGFEHLTPAILGYSPGFFVSDYRGHIQLQHSGGLPGYVSLVTMIPDQKIGIAVLTNQESSEAFFAITLRAIDEQLAVKPPDYLRYFRAARDSNTIQLSAARNAVTAVRDSMSGPSLKAVQYAGTYADAWYGNITLEMEPKGLVIRFSNTPGMVGDLVHWQHDTFLVRWRDRELRADAYITFSLNPDGTVAEARMAPASGDVDFSFDFADLLLRPVKRGR